MWDCIGTVCKIVCGLWEIEKMNKLIVDRHIYCTDFVVEHPKSVQSLSGSYKVSDIVRKNS